MTVAGLGRARAGQTVSENKNESQLRRKKSKRKSWTDGITICKKKMRENKRVKVKIGMKVKLKGNREELTDGYTEVKMRF